MYNFGLQPLVPSVSPMFYNISPMFYNISPIFYNISPMFYNIFNVSETEINDKSERKNRGAFGAHLYIWSFTYEELNPEYRIN